MIAGTVFPPRDEWDVAAYETDDCVQGYRDWRPDEPAPGGNRPAGYRWGWANAERDRHGPDEHDAVRSAYIRMTRRAH